MDRDPVGENHCTEEGNDCQEDLILYQRKRNAGHTEQDTDDIRPDRPPVINGKLIVELIPVFFDSALNGRPESVAVNRAVCDDLQCVMEMLLIFCLCAEGFQIVIYFIIDPGLRGIKRAVKIGLFVNTQLNYCSYIRCSQKRECTLAPYRYCVILSRQSFYHIYRPFRKR